MSNNDKSSNGPGLSHAKLEKAEAEALFRSIGQAVIVTDSQGRVSHVNQVTLDILGYTKDEILGRWFTEFVQAIDAQGQSIPPMERPITRAFLTGKTVNSKIYYKIKSCLLPVSVTVSPVMYQGEPIGAIELFSDISQEIEADRMKSDFISLASHQLRTPLSAINMYSHILFSGLRGPLTTEQKGLMKIILSSVDQMNELINTLLNIAYIETGKMKVVAKPFSPGEIINDAIDSFSPQIAHKSIKIKKRLPGPKQQIITDPTLVREIYANLISNAIKYSRRGGTITISQSLSKKYSLFKISDKGIGIPLSAQPYIYTKFYRAVNASSKTPEGTGLGLYIVKQITNILGGEAWFESKTGEGSTFCIRIPREHAAYKERARILA